MNVGDLRQNRGFDAPRVTRKSGRQNSLAINPQATQRIQAYLERAGHGAEHDAPLFRPLHGNKKPLDGAGHRDPPTTKPYDRRYYNPEGAASFVATY